MQVFNEYKNETECESARQRRENIQYKRDLEFIRGMHQIKATVSFKKKHLTIDDVKLLSREDARKLSKQLRKQLTVLGFLAFVLS